MIRKLNEADREPLMKLLSKEPALNLFIIGDVENFGMQQDFMELWGEHDAQTGVLKAVLLRYYGGFLPYADGPFDAEGFAALLRNAQAAEMISGSTEVVRAFDGIVPLKEEKQMLFAELKEMNDEIRQAATGVADIQKAAVHDVEAICTLTDQIEEFSSSAADSRTSLYKSLESGTGRTYFIEQEGKVIASASTAAENSLSAMIVGVATHPEHRGRGLATRVVAKLCGDLLADGKSLCLFYNNPQAGLIYQKLGFRDIGSWTMMYLQQQ